MQLKHCHRICQQSADPSACLELSLFEIKDSLYPSPWTAVGRIAFCTAKLDEIASKCIKRGRRGGGGGPPPSGSKVSARQNKYFWRLLDSKKVSENTSKLISFHKTSTSSIRKTFGTTHAMVSAPGCFHTIHYYVHLIQIEMYQMDFWRA